MPADAHRHNNFGLLRLIFAVLVLYSHCYPLTRGTNNTEPLVRFTGTHLTLGSAAVDGFFVISGLLITQSWQRSRTAADFIVKRILRIYPGYIVAVFFSIAAGLAGSWPDWLKYAKALYYDNDLVLRSLFFLDYGVLDQEPAFATNPFIRVNGSLWTLQPEIRCYAVLLALGCFGLLTRRRLMFVILLASYAIYAANDAMLGVTGHKMSRFFTCFLLGSVFALNTHWLAALTPLRLLFLATALGASMLWPPAFTLIYPPLFAAIVLGLAFSQFSPAAGVLARYDLSYGIYLYAFPVQQLLVKFAEIRSPGLLLAAALPVTTVLAMFSWVFVESRAIATKKTLTA